MVSEFYAAPHTYGFSPHPPPHPQTRPLSLIVSCTSHLPSPSFPTSNLSLYISSWTLTLFLPKFCSLNPLSLSPVLFFPLCPLIPFSTHHFPYLSLSLCFIFPANHNLFSSFLQLFIFPTHHFPHSFLSILILSDFLSLFFSRTATVQEDGVYIYCT